MANAAETAEQYGYVQSLFNAVPELKNLFNKAVKGQWAADKFQAELRNTKWWKSHAQSERDYLVLQYGDPATAKLKLSQAVTQVKQLAATIGLSVNSASMSKISAAAYNVVAKGWTDQDLRYYLGQYITFPAGSWNGEGGSNLQELETYAYNMGVKPSTSFFTNAARNIERGVASVQQYESQIRNQAKTLFPDWAKQIDSGQNVSDLASPYMQSMSTILEIPPGSVNLFDPTIKSALQYKDPKTGANSSMPIWQFENQLRNDPRWAGTKNAQDSTMQVAHQVLSDFGVAF